MSQPSTVQDRVDELRKKLQGILGEKEWCTTPVMVAAALPFLVGILMYLIKPAAVVAADGAISWSAFLLWTLGVSAVGWAGIAGYSYFTE